MRMHTTISICRYPVIRLKMYLSNLKRTHTQKRAWESSAASNELSLLANVKVRLNRASKNKSECPQDIIANEWR